MLRRAPAQAASRRRCRASLSLVSASAGQRVKAGETLAVLEAMKMQHVIAAPVDGVVREVFVAVGRQLALGAPILDIEEDRIMRLSEAADFRDESLGLFALVDTLAPADFERRTPVQGLDGQRRAGPSAFLEYVPSIFPCATRPSSRRGSPTSPPPRRRDSLRAYENAAGCLRGRELANSWMELAEDIASRWREIDPKTPPALDRPVDVGAIGDDGAADGDLGARFRSL